MQFGVQLYNFRDYLAKDFKGVLKEIAKIGFDGVEFFSAYHDHSPEEVAAMLKETGLQCCGTMFGIDALKDKDSNAWNYVKALNPPAVSTSVMGDFREKWEMTRENCKIVSAVAAEKGTRFSYHNHWAEFTLIDGITAMERILDAPGAEKVMMEPDICWLTRGKQSPVAFIKKYAERICQIHFKDIVVPEDPETTVPLGKGCIDLNSVYETAKAIHCPWLIYEQDTTTDPFLNAAESLQYLRSLK